MLAECMEGNRTSGDKRTKRKVRMPSGKASTGKGNRDRVGKKVDWQAEYNCCVLAKGGGEKPLYL